MYNFIKVKPILLESINGGLPESHRSISSEGEVWIGVSRGLWKKIHLIHSDKRTHNCHRKNVTWTKQSHRMDYRVCNRNYPYFYVHRTHQVSWNLYQGRGQMGQSFNAQYLLHNKCSFKKNTSCPRNQNNLPNIASGLKEAKSKAKWL